MPEPTAEDAIIRLARADAEWKRTRRARRESFSMTQRCIVPPEVQVRARSDHATFLAASLEHRTALNAVLRLGRKLGAL